MSLDREETARRAVRDAQRRFDQETTAAQTARRDAFAKAQKDGLSLRDIAKEVGLHHSRIAQIIKGK